MCRRILEHTALSWKLQTLFLAKERKLSEHVVVNKSFLLKNAMGIFFFFLQNFLFQKLCFGKTFI